MFRVDGAGDGKRGPREPDHVLGPTHEEVITPLIRAEITSYRDLPRNFRSDVPGGRRGRRQARAPGAGPRPRPHARGGNHAAHPRGDHELSGPAPEFQIGCSGWTARATASAGPGSRTTSSAPRTRR